MDRQTKAEPGISKVDAFLIWLLPQFRDSNDIPPNLGLSVIPMSDAVRTFRAASKEEAMAKIRRELGLDARVVEVKEVAATGLFSWMSSRIEVEVTASAVSRSKHNVFTSTNSSRTPIPTNAGTIAAAAAAAKREKASETANTTNRVTNRDTNPELASSKSAPSDSVAMTIEQRLDTLQQMIMGLGRSSRRRGVAEIPHELFSQYLSLVEADVDDEIAYELILKLKRHSTAAQFTDESAMKAMLTALIEQRISCAEPLSPRPGHRQIAMLVGPTGVGKTTTLAKLAGNFGLGQGLKLGLLTVDTYRVAAVEQLRTYAEIIGLPIRVVTNRQEIQLALDSFADRDLLLVDTAGRSPQDERHIEELRQLIEVIHPDHVYLVLSLAAGAKSLRSAAERFAAANVTSLVLTKLDEAVGCGGLLAASHEIRLPISYFTTGQEVPRDIEPANPCRAARLILGPDRLKDRSPFSPAKGIRLPDASL